MVAIAAVVVLVSWWVDVVPTPSGLVWDDVVVRRRVAAVADVYPKRGPQYPPATPWAVEVPTLPQLSQFELVDAKPPHAYEPQLADPPPRAALLGLVVVVPFLVLPLIVLDRANDPLFLLLVLVARLQLVLEPVRTSVLQRVAQVRTLRHLL